jgi:hypothetical protein
MPSTVGAVFAAGAILANFLVLGRAVVVLNVGLALCFVLWARQPWGDAPPALRGAYVCGILVQALHLGEEYVTAFYRSFPALFGYEWTASRFLAFNLCWLALFTLALGGLRRGARWGYLLVLFMALVGGVGNGLGHVALAVLSQGYFPGLYTAPLCLLMGAVILRLLPRAFVRPAPPA